jgi:hypothetical protein
LRAFDTEAWKELKPSSDREQTVLEVELLGQFETAAVPLMGQSAFGHLGGYSHELILADVLSSRPAQFSGQTEQSSKAVNVTVCEIVEGPLRFVGKRVRLSAKFQSDGIEHTVLTDPDCGRGIEPFVLDEVEQHPDIQALDRALDKGMRGTLDKRFAKKLPAHESPVAILASETRNGSMRVPFSTECKNLKNVFRIIPPSRANLV